LKEKWNTSETRNKMLGPSSASNEEKEKSLGNPVPKAPRVSETNIQKTAQESIGVEYLDSDYWTSEKR